MTTYEDTAQALVQNRFDDLAEYADTAFTLAENYINTLSGMLEELTVPDVSEIGDVNIPTYTPIDYTARPSLGTGIFTPSTAEEPNKIEGFNDITVNDLSDAVDEFETAITGAPSVAMDYESKTYSSDLAQKIVDMLAEGFANAEVYSQLILDSSTDSLDVIIGKLLDSGSSGINGDIEELIYERGKARLRVENENLYQQVVNEFGTKGFNLPPGIFTANVARVQREIALKIDNLNYEIITNQATLAQANRQFMIQNATQFEGVLINFFNDSENRELEAEKARLEKCLADIELYKTKIEAAKEKLTATFDEKRFLLEENTSLIDKYKADIGAYTAKLTAESNLNERELSAFQATATAYEVETNAEKAKNLTIIEESRVQIQEAQIRLDQIKSELELTTSGYIAVKELQLKGTEGVMNSVANLAASSMNAANASASYGFSNSSSGSWAYHPDVAETENTNYNLTTKS